MAIDKVIYNNGIKGLLSHYEIDSLPKDYEMHKGSFHEMTEKVTGKKRERSTKSKLSIFIYRILSFFRKLIEKIINKKV